MSFFSKKIRAIVIAVLVLAAADAATAHFAGIDPIGAAVKTVTAPVKTGFSYIAAAVNDAVGFVWDMRAYKTDNEKLEEENMRLKREARDTASYREENERLSELLELKNSITDYTTVAARVIAYSPNNWYDTIEINKGSLAGLAEGNAVITPDGVVGKITEVGPNYSVVTTILDPSSAVGIRVSRTGGNGLAEGDAELSKELKCKLSFMDRNTPVIVGDVIETSGSGGIYPPGFVIGTIASISADSTGSLRYAVVASAVDMSELGEVLVINGITG